MRVAFELGLQGEDHGFDVVVAMAGLLLLVVEAAELHEASVVRVAGAGQAELVMRRVPAPAAASPTARSIARPTRLPRHGSTGARSASPSMTRKFLSTLRRS